MPKYIQDIDMCGNSVTGLPAPVSGSDAANKEYVDNEAEWFNIYNKVRLTVSHNPTLVIENYNENLLDNLSHYRIVLLRYKKISNKGARKWCMPMWSYELSPNGDPSCRIAKDDTYWKITGKETQWFHVTGNDIYSVLGVRDEVRDGKIWESKLSKSSYKTGDAFQYADESVYKVTRLRTLKAGVAIYKYIEGKGKIGWHRCSNIATVEFNQGGSYKTGIE